MKDFEFTKNMKIIQQASIATCQTLHVWNNPEPGVDYKTANAKDYSEKEILNIIEKQTVFYTTAMLENQNNIKKICEMLDRGGRQVGGILENRPIIKAIVEHARNEYLTEILTGKIKTI